MRRGYVFVLALWTIVILAVLSGAAFTAMSSANATLRAIIDRERSITAFTDAEARLLYLLLTEPIGLSALHVGGQLDPDPTIGGFAFGGELVDTQGAPYRMNTSQGPVIVRLIAANGLINLSGDTVLSARALLTAQGLSEPAANRLPAGSDRPWAGSRARALSTVSPERLITPLAASRRTITGPRAVIIR